MDSLKHLEEELWYWTADPAPLNLAPFLSSPSFCGFLSVIRPESGDMWPFWCDPAEEVLLNSSSLLTQFCLLSSTSLSLMVGILSHDLHLPTLPWSLLSLFRRQFWSCCCPGSSESFISDWARRVSQRKISFSLSLVSSSSYTCLMSNWFSLHSLFSMFLASVLAVNNCLPDSNLHSTILFLYPPWWGT